MSKGIFIEGVKRSGKTKFAVDLMAGYIKRGCKVATNLDLFLENLDPKGNNSVIRLPDHPRSCDFIALESAYPELDPDKPETYDEKKNGLVVIDELLTFLNSRDWKEKDRAVIVSWMVQMGKYGWDLVAIGQDFDSVDKQLRATTINSLYDVKNGRNYFGFGLFNTLASKMLNLFNIPQFSIARFYDSQSNGRKAHGHEFFIKSWCHGWYKTAQRFLPDQLLTKDNRLVDMRASYSMLPGKTLNEWYPKEEVKKQTLEDVKQAAQEVETKSKEIKKDLESKEEVKKDKKPLLPTWKIMLLALSVYVAYSFFQTDKPQAQTQTSQTTTNIKNILQKTPLPTVLKGVYITCSVKSEKGTDYCFERNGNPFYPEDIEIWVVASTSCSASLIVDKQLHKVYCNPEFVQPWSSARPQNENINLSETETLLASN
jgi:hypothetical protein